MPPDPAAADLAPASNRARVVFQVAMRLLVVATLVAFALVVWNYRERAGIEMSLRGFVEALRALIEPIGPLGPIAFMAVLALRPLVLFPSWVLFMGGGMVFGVLPGIAYGLLGALFGAVLGFALARYLGRRFVEWWIGPRLSAFVDGRWGVRLVFVLSAVPLVPISIINFGAGLSAMRLPQFVAASAAGLLPRVAAYATLGEALLSPQSPIFWASIAALALLAAIPIALRVARARAARKVTSSRS
jgi:uncharacterized membrane protein YdjX (TVP38/TMEM64 family)